MSLRRAIEDDVESVAVALLGCPTALWPDQAERLRRLLDHMHGRPRPCLATERPGEYAEVNIGSVTRVVLSCKRPLMRGPAGSLTWKPDGRQLLVHARYVCELAHAAVRSGAVLGAGASDALGRLQRNATVADSALRLGGSIS